MYKCIDVVSILGFVSVSTLCMSVFSHQYFLILYFYWDFVVFTNLYCLICKLVLFIVPILSFMILLVDHPDIINLSEIGWLHILPMPEYYPNINQIFSMLLSKMWIPSRILWDFLKMNYWIYCQLDFMICKRDWQIQT